MSYVNWRNKNDVQLTSSQKKKNAITKKIRFKKFV